ncbi:MAG: biopolymer transporter ExbD [Akkermansiaceae bacterium]|nr:biopolymer transporter ExbD [Akkermansiaceae bacterium]MCP5549536.1 biopolymer transporter ExbD [Akkermansiaceae bacterium]
MKFRDYHQQQTAELELAPMIDVVFLLLIFFIVTWQFARFERDMDVSVPAAEQVDDGPRQIGEIIVNVRKSGDVFINGAQVSDDEMLARFRLISSAYPDQAVILRGDAEATYQSIIDVLDVIKEAGIWNVAFATARPETPPRK